ncbi:MAG TPA: M15 family metallopeptidase [Actinomycetes bacterium]|nr:M15 family metallopeptidase [Actinomycetes bacterium]
MSSAQPPRRRVAALAAILALASVAACSRSGAGAPPATTAAAAPARPAPGTAAPPAPTTTAAPPRPLPARFAGGVTPLPAALAASMRGSTWQPGCPVPLGDLRLLTLRYWGFDGRVHQGPLVVNAAAAEPLVSVFRRLFQARFPIDRLHLAVQYVPGHDDPNDARDYTAGFNCRPVVSARGPVATWSQHAWGLAVDVNPIENPAVTSAGYVRNNHARAYRDRSLRRPGMIRPGDVVVRAFAGIGWRWGGYWSGDKDYMHFSANGR